jgi:hypothetical protein
VKSEALKRVEDRARWTRRDWKRGSRQKRVGAREVVGYTASVVEVAMRNADFICVEIA